MDYALDPNDDGLTDDRVDVINLSLGFDYGQAFDDDLSQAVENATDLGVPTVAAAGNGSDHPYVSGSPAATPSVLSVAQTAVPSAELALLEVVSPAELAGLYEATHQDWSAELTALVTGDLFFDDSTEGRRLGCRLDDDDPETPNPEGENPFEPGELTGLIVLVERGGCNFSEKIANVALAGGEIGIIGLVTEDEPFSGAPGDCQADACHDIPGYMIRQSLTEALQAARAEGTVAVELDPAAGLDLQQTMVSRPRAGRRCSRTSSSPRSVHRAHPSRPRSGLRRSPRRSAGPPARRQWSPDPRRSCSRRSRIDRRPRSRRCS